MKMEQTECSEMSAYKIQMLGNYPEENIQDTSNITNAMQWGMDANLYKLQASGPGEDKRSSAHSSFFTL